MTEFAKAVQYIYSFIPKTDINRFPGERGMQRVQKLLAKLGDPQETYKVVHIAGTSGKGSTGQIIAALLIGQGFKVGLHVKPHITDIRERFQINNGFITEEKFITYSKHVIDVVQTIDTPELGRYTYYEVTIALTYYIFAQERVQYAVIETGVGGLLDGSNNVKNPEKLCVLTKIGYDHTKLLGTTLDKIAFQKAGIIHSGNIAISVPQKNTGKASF